MTKQVGGFRILFISEKDLDNHEQAMLEKLLRSAHIDQHHVALRNIGRGRDCVFAEIHEIKPRVIIALGKNVSRILLREKTSFKLGPHIGKVHDALHLGESIVVIPLQAMSFLLRRGIKEVQRAIVILKCCKRLSC